MAKGIERELYFGINVVVWFEDFMTAVNAINPMWIKAYQLSKARDVEDSTLSYHTLANDFLRDIRPLGTAKPSVIAKGSFRITFTGQSAEDKIDMLSTSTD